MIIRVDQQDVNCSSVQVTLSKDSQAINIIFNEDVQNDDYFKKLLSASTITITDADKQQKTYEITQDSGNVTINYYYDSTSANLTYNVKNPE